MSDDGPKVVSLHGGEFKAPTNEDNERRGHDVVRCLAMLMRRAIKGEIQGIAIAYVNGKGNPGSVWSGHYGTQAWGLHAGVNMLLDDLSAIAREADGAETEVPDVTDDEVSGILAGIEEESTDADEDQNEIEPPPA